MAEQNHYQRTQSEQTLYTIRQLVALDEFSFLTESSVRHYIFYSQPRPSAFGGNLPPNGLLETGAIIRIGRKILIDINLFRKWLRQANGIVPANACNE